MVPVGAVASCGGSRGCRHTGRHCAGARRRTEREPGGVVTRAPTQSSAPRVADGQSLRGEIAAPLLDRKGETRWARSNGGRYRRCGDGERQFLLRNTSQMIGTTDSECRQKR
jgi:hypothetical protein